MAKKNIADEDGYGAGSQSNTDTTYTNAQPTPNTGKRSLSKYIAIMIIVVVAIVIIYDVSTGLGGPSLNSKQIFSSVSNSSLNQTQSLFIKDLEKSENVTSLQVMYYSNNATSYITPSNNLTIAITSNQTINSYKLGNYNKTVITSIVAYTNSKNGVLIAKNVSSIYYYNTNATVLCSNDTTYSSTLVTNSSLQCGSGDQGFSSIEEAPYTAVNVSSLSYLIFNSTVTYSGTKSIAGRNCDYFIISNATSSNLQTNYTVSDLCVDTQYGVLLYLNATDVVGGVPNSFVFTATAVSTNVPSSEFVIPQQYLNAIPHSII
jgi:hypothetical protein